jgi:Na+/melibiose symporter-like transporter
MMVYSANNLPYSALSGVMTGDVAERTSLSQYRFVGAMLSQLVIQSLALPMVNYLGGGDDARGYRLTMTVFGVLAVAFFVITFATTRERIRPAPDQRSSVRQDFADLLKNGPWVAMFVLTILLFVTLALRGGVMLYYFKYYVGREDLFSIFNVFGTGATIVGVLLSKGLALRYGKRNLFIAGLVGTALCTAAFAVLPRGASVTNSRMVSTNIATHGPFLNRSAKSCRTDDFWSGAGRMRSRVVANVMAKNTAASTPNTVMVSR